MVRADDSEGSSTIARRLGGLRAGPAATRTPPTLYLTVERGPDAGRSYAVGGGGATIGRHEDSTIIPNDSRLSRRHARIEARDGGFVVRDLGSTNGTILNGQPLDEPRPIRAGDLLQLGDTALRVGDAPPTAGVTPPGTRPGTTSRLAATTGRMPAPQRTATKDGGLVRTPWHERGASSQPVFEIRRGRLFRTPWHELGPSQFPEYEMRGTFVYRTAHHEARPSRTPDYELRDGFLYRTGWHERGPGRQPDYQLD